MQKKGNKFGTHRVISPKGVLPQPADKIDNNMDEIYDNEILIDVMTLNIDSASFTQINEQAGGDEEKIKEIMFDIVAKQGKHRNPVTGSGGMLLGTVEKIGDALKGKIDLKEGDKIATLVSLSLTPLRIDKIKSIRKDVDQVDIEGKAILFETGIYAKIPSDLPENRMNRIPPSFCRGYSGTGEDLPVHRLPSILLSGNTDKLPKRPCPKYL